MTNKYLAGNVHLNGDGFPVGYSVMGIKPKGRLLLQQLQKEELDASVARTHREAFTSLDRRGFSEKDDTSLAKWQSEHKQDEPEWRLAEQEWQRRLTAQQIKATMDAARWQAWFRILAVVIGALLGARVALAPSHGQWHHESKQETSQHGGQFPTTIQPPSPGEQVPSRTGVGLGLELCRQTTMDTIPPTTTAPIPVHSHQRLPDSGTAAPSCPADVWCRSRPA